MALGKAPAPPTEPLAPNGAN